MGGIWKLLKDFKFNNTLQKQTSNDKNYSRRKRSIIKSKSKFRENEHRIKRNFIKNRAINRGEKRSLSIRTKKNNVSN